MQTKSPFRAILVTTWTILTFVCFLIVMPSIGNDPCYSRELASKWPNSTNLTKVSNSGHLVVFAHPYCPCTRTTLRNLDELTDLTKINVSVVQLRNASLESLRSPIPSIARIVQENNWILIPDYEGTQANIFGAKTSGECLLYAPNGDLLFAGGITVSRGHQGENVGLATLKELVHQIASTPKRSVNATKEKSSSESNKYAQFPTCGCPLFGETGSGSDSFACNDNAL